MRIGVVDYGLGNLRSVLNALTRCAPEVTLVDTAAGVDRCEGLVLPGVGAFERGMANLHRSGLTRAVNRFAVSDRPILGICLGMQLLFDVGEEFGEVEGLGLIPGRVVSLREFGGEELRLPHVGWSALEPAERAWHGTLLDSTRAQDRYYFVHSYAPYDCPLENTLARTSYGTVSFPSVVTRANVVGTQFHPEKSGRAGLELLHHFTNPTDAR